MYSTVIFDLDGTVVDSGKGVIHSVQYALKKFGIDEEYDNLRCFMGPPLLESFAKFYNMSSKDAQLCLKYYREYYTSKGILESEVYDGIPMMLEKLHKNNKRMIIGTSKPDLFAEKILQELNLIDYFDGIVGANMEETRSTKIEVLEYAFEKIDIDAKNTVMVGDRYTDIEGAIHFGMDSIGVLYGYGSRDELVSAGATYIAEKPEEAYGIINA